MAFVHRTTREAAKADAQYETPEHLGPGAYQLRSGFGPTRPSFAPFGSTGVRKTVTDQVKLVTPGPGTYDEQPMALGIKGNASAFRSATRRFTSMGASKNRTPGPGQYDIAAASERLVKHGRVRAKKNVKRHTYKTVASAPSIPGKADQFGYDEKSNGRLQKQVAPVRGHKGRDGDTVGPGQYNISQDIAKPKKGGADFSRSTSTRYDGKADESAHMGPGYYDITGESTAPFRRPPSESVSFKSTTKRSDPAAAFAGVNSPGPAAYGARSSFRKQTKQENLQFFGSSSARFGSNSRQLRTAGGRPGPGTYKAPSAFKLRKSKGKLEPGVGFTGSSSRFQDKYETLGAGPARTSPDVYSFTHALERKPVGRNTSFGTTTKKFFVPGTKLAKPPGPGAYAGSHVDSPQTLLAARRPTSTMASSTVRFVPEKHSGNPEPGEYDVTRTWKVGKRRTGTMQYGPDRFSTPGHDPMDTPGPGAYPSKSSLKPAPPNRKNILQSTGPRFQPSESVYAQPKPGPGTYNVEHLYGNLNRPTFNITIAEEMYK